MSKVALDSRATCSTNHACSKTLTATMNFDEDEFDFEHDKKKKINNNTDRR
jgi:hypothetical protein